MIIFGGGFIFSISFLKQGFHIIQKTQLASAWSEHHAVINKIDVVVRSTGSSSRGTSYGIMINYKYLFDGKEYFGDTFNYSYPLVGWLKAEAEIERKRYDQKEIIKIYVNPLDPSESVVQPHMRGKVWQPIIFGIVFAMLPFILLYYFIKTPLPRY